MDNEIKERKKERRRIMDNEIKEKRKKEESWTIRLKKERKKERKKEEKKKNHGQ